MDYPQFTPILRKNKHLTLTERVKIELLTNDGKTPYAIAKVLDRPINTIINELERGTVKQIKHGKPVKCYFADSGQARYEENRKKCGRKCLAMQCADFVDYVESTMIEEKWSVDGTVGRAAATGAFGQILCTKTIYRYIDLGLMKIKNTDLPIKLRRNTHKPQVRVNKRVLGDSIEIRPTHIDERQEFGHWEIDTVIGVKSEDDEALLTLVERKTRNAMVRKIAGKTADAVMKEINRLKDHFGSMFSGVFKTITSDNGSEFAFLASLNQSRTSIFFTHPYSSWERGTNERHNGLFRRFIPKGKRISDYSIDAIARVEDWCNNLPRKILGYKTPEELFEAELDQIYAL